MKTKPFTKKQRAELAQYSKASAFLNNLATAALLNELSGIVSEYYRDVAAQLIAEGWRFVPPRVKRRV